MDSCLREVRHFCFFIPTSIITTSHSILPSNNYRLSLPHSIPLPLFHHSIPLSSFHHSILFHPSITQSIETIILALRVRNFEYLVSWFIWLRANRLIIDKNWFNFLYRKQECLKSMANRQTCSIFIATFDLHRFLPGSTVSILTPRRVSVRDDHADHSIWPHR